MFCWTSAIERVLCGVFLVWTTYGVHARIEDDEHNFKDLHVRPSSPWEPCLEHELIARCVKPAPELHAYLSENTTFLEPLFFPETTGGFILCRYNT